MQRLPSTRVVIAYDPQGARLPALPAEQGIRVVGWVSIRRDLAAVLPLQAPQIVVADLRCCAALANDSLAAIRRAVPAAKLLALGPPEDVALAQSALEHGASGYLTRRIDRVSIMLALTTIRSGAIYLTRTGRRAVDSRLATATADSAPQFDEATFDVGRAAAALTSVVPSAITRR
jgi:two-component system uhpT operon response regulator UhpA